jgi:hypothetical protein
MRILLQDRKSQLYFKGANDWTADINNASDFLQVIKALDYARATRLPNLDALMHFEDPKYDIRISASH